jgi:hypothetical protein
MFSRHKTKKESTFRVNRFTWSLSQVISEPPSRQLHNLIYHVSSFSLPDRSAHTRRNEKPSVHSESHY